MFENFDWIGAMRSSPVMLVILICSVMTVGFAMERLIYYTKRRGNPDGVLATALIAVRGGNREEAVRVLNTCSHPLGPVGSEILRNGELSSEAAEEKLQIALSEQRMQLERNLGFIGTMGNTAPLIGLLGTVWGIMRAFHDMARTGSAGPSVVASGVAEALFTTAAGLMIAVPAVILYNHFTRRATNVMSETENYARKLRLTLQEPQADRATHKLKVV